MQRLEKILKEIEQKIEMAKAIIVDCPHDKLDEIANDTAEAFIEAYEECQDIIRKHMNDGWIPVEDRLPEDTDEDYYQSVIVTLLDGRVAPGVYREQDEEWWVEDEEGIKEYTLNQDVIAWCPMPESYRPERSDGK